MEKALLALLIVVVSVIIFGLVLIYSSAEGALSQGDLHLVTKIYEKLTYMLWEDKHQSALQVRNEALMVLIQHEMVRQTKLLDHIDCILTNEMMHGGVDNPKRTLPIDCNDGFPLNLTGTWNPGYWERNPEGS